MVLTYAMRSGEAAGNITTDPSNYPLATHTYRWDVEGRVWVVDPGSSPTWSFTYNAVGDRVQWAYPGGANQQMFDPNGGWLGIAGALDVLRWGDGAYAWYTGTETYFNHINNISTTSMLTNHLGTPVYDLLYYPWGQMPPWRSWGGGGANYAELPYQDPNTSTNIAMFRFHSPAVGRWLSPDPVAGDITNPQSLNRYVYVMNNPTSLIDPLGLGPCINGIDQTTLKNCNPQRAAQSNLPGQWQDIFGFGSGFMNWDSFYFLTINSTPPPGWVPDDYQSTCPGCYVPPDDSDLVWNPANYQSLLGLLDANNGTPQQPSKLSEKLERLKNCALGYYGIDPLSVAGLSSDAKWALIAASAGGIPKSVAADLGLRVIMQPGASEYTSALSMLSLATGGGGALRTIANFGSKWAGPIAIASAVIDATAIGICTASD